MQIFAMTRKAIIGWFMVRFFSGIYIVRLDNETGKCLVPGDYGKQLAVRSLSVEGQLKDHILFIIKRQNIIIYLYRWIL